jgi:hypothetical protein
MTEREKLLEQALKECLPSFERENSRRLNDWRTADINAKRASEALRRAAEYRRLLLS